MVAHTFPAMGTTFTFLVHAEDAPDLAETFADAEAVVHDLERRLSRFRPDSELSRLNRAGSGPVGDDLALLISFALEARADTRGRFDPTVYQAMLAAGYDTTFEALCGKGSHGGARCGGAVRFDPARRTVQLDRGVGLDLGAIAKGYAAEMACGMLAPAGPSLVNAGGDIAVNGVPPSGAWPVEVPTTGRSMVVGLHGGGLATSGIDRRRWRVGDHEHHHIIDPATGRPAAGEVLRVTVIANSAIRAEVLATSFFLLGPEGALAAASDEAAQAIVVTTDGRTYLSEGIV